MTQPETPKHRRGLLAGLRSSFLTGLVAIAPIGLTLWLIWTAVNWIDSWVLPFIPARYHPAVLTGWDIPGVGVIIFLLFTILAGWIAKGFLGRSLIGWGENLVARMPVVRSIYKGVKQIAETVFAQGDSNFERACLVEYPRPGIWAIAFISTTTKGEIASSLSAQGEMSSVFLPTTPNPTSGFLLFVPTRNLIFLEMRVEDAAKLVISAGLVYPNPKDPKTPPVTRA
jgi:uncharacterized membrane protein